METTKLGVSDCGSAGANASTIFQTPVLSCFQPYKWLSGLQTKNVNPTPNQRKQGIVDFEARNPNDLASIVNQSHINQGQTTPNRSVQSGDTDFSVHRVRASSY